MSAETQRNIWVRLRRLATSRVVRRRVYEMLDDAHLHPRALFLHRSLIALVLASVLSVILESVPSLAKDYGPLFLSVEIVAIAVFTVEYAARLWVATEHPPFRALSAWRARLRHALTPSAIIDLLAVLPLYLSLILPSDFGVFLLIRLLRFFKLARYSSGARSIVEAISRERRALGASALIVAGEVLVAATLMHLAEGKIQPDKLGTLPDAIYWAIITIGTVGYGDIVPITAPGKLIASISALLGLLTLAMPVGIIATAFAEAIQRREFVVTWSMVARVPIFADLVAADIAEIMRYLHARTAEEDEYIYRKGDAAHAMFFIASGEVEIELVRKIRLGEGHFFGELAVLKDTRRSANVRALTRSKLLVLEAFDLRALMKRKPKLAQAIIGAAQQRHVRPVADGDLTTGEIEAQEAVAAAGEGE